MSNYEIGYMKPPKSGQFKPGQSGNPKGRPKGHRNTYDMMEEILHQKISITEDGQRKKISKQMAILTQSINSAVKGHPKAINIILPYMLAIDERRESLNKLKEALSTNDQQIIQTIEKRILNKNNKEIIDV